MDKATAENLRQELLAIQTQKPIDATEAKIADLYKQLEIVQETELDDHESFITKVESDYCESLKAWRRDYKKEQRAFVEECKSYLATRTKQCKDREVGVSSRHAVKLTQEIDRVKARFAKKIDKIKCAIELRCELIMVTANERALIDSIHADAILLKANQRCNIELRKLEVQQTALNKQSTKEVEELQERFKNLLLEQKSVTQSVVERAKESKTLYHKGEAFKLKHRRIYRAIVTKHEREIAKCNTPEEIYKRSDAIKLKIQALREKFFYGLMNPIDKEMYNQIKETITAKSLKSDQLLLVNQNQGYFAKYVGINEFFFSFGVKLK